MTHHDPAHMPIMAKEKWQRRRWSILLMALVFIGISVACIGTYSTMQVSGLPQYTCPSSTPRPTDTPYPTSLPTYPTAFQADLDYTFVDPLRSIIFIQYMGQATGAMTVTLSGIYADGSPWSGGTFQAAYFPPSGSGWASSSPVSIPLALQAATIRIVAAYYVYNFPVAVYQSPQPIRPPNPGPTCCIPNPIYPTPVPTYTPYPTPTEYIRQNDYFIGDWVYDLYGTKLGYKVDSIESRPTTTIGPTGLPQTLYVWRLSIRNRGTQEYNVFPAAQSFVSEIILLDGTSENGFWGASVAAALEAQAGSNYDMVSLEPGQSHDFIMAAYGPLGQVRRIAFALDFTARPTPGDIRPGPTQVAGRNVVTWLNEVNTVCQGDIQQP